MDYSQLMQQFYADGMTILCCWVVKRMMFPSIPTLHQHKSASQLPLILWQYGFITVQQLDYLLDWLIGARLGSIDG
jgi:hypothetical protein